MPELNTRRDLQAILGKAAASTAEGMTITDARSPDMPLVYVNQGFCDLTGYTREECLGKNCWFLQGEATHPDAVRRIRRGLERGEKTVTELLHYRKDGSTFWNRVSIVPVFDDTGTLTHFVGIQSDITHIKEVEKEAHQLAALRTTMRTVGDIVFNYMAGLQHFRLELEDAGVDETLLAEFDRGLQDTEARLRRIESLTSFKVVDNGSGAPVIDMSE